jgi:hypothetical protein
MNEAYIKSIDFVIPKKNYLFSGRIRTFCRRNTDFYEKKPLLCRPPSAIAVRAITFFYFNLETSSIQVSNILVLRGACCFFSNFDEFIRVASKRKFGLF